MDEAHAKAQVKSKQEMIDDERARECEERERCKEERKKKKKKKRKKDDDDDDDDDKDDDPTYHPSQDKGDEDDEWLPSKGELRRADEEGDY